MPGGTLVPPPLPPPPPPARHFLAAPGQRATTLAMQTDAAITFFTSERTPAALLCVMALSVLFAVPIKPGEDTPLIGGVKRLFILMAGAALCNALVSVFAASLAIVTLLGNNHNALARSATDMMHREIPLFLFAVRAHFITAILCLASALAARMWLEFRTGCPPFSRGMLFLLGSTVMFMLHLFNTSLLHVRSYGDMLLHYARHYLHHIATRANTGPSLYAAVVLALLAAREFAHVAYHIITKQCAEAGIL